MNPITYLALAAVAAPPAGADMPDYRMPERIVPGRCAPAAGEEIVVCGRPPDTYRYREIELPEGVEAPAPDGSFGIGLAPQVRAEVDTIVRPDGFIDRRLMIKWRIPF